jgi:hypothetical protein
MKNLSTFENFVNESTKSTDLYWRITDAINMVDENLDYKDFAAAVAKVMDEEYGSHNFKPFMDELKKLLK